MAKPRGKKSAGILLFRRVKGAVEGESAIEVMLGHPGGPYWARKDDHAWSIPKGEFDTEEPLDAAKREFAEETGGTVTGAAIPLSPVQQSGGKIVHAFAVEQDFDPARLTSNTFEMEWPPKSGRVDHYPEIDRVAWFSVDAARTKLMRGQVDLLDQLMIWLAANPSDGVHVTPAGAS